MLAKVPGKRVDPDAFDGRVTAMERIVCAATLRIAKIAPTGGFVASAGRAQLLDQGLSQYEARPSGRTNHPPRAG